MVKLLTKEEVLSKIQFDENNNRFVDEDVIEALIYYYSKGEPLVDDAVYDALLEAHLAVVGEDHRPFLRQKQSSAINDIVGTLTKAYGVLEPMRPGQKTYRDWVCKKAYDWDSDKLICVQSKFDGVSVAFDMFTRTFATRGDYDNGISVDVTELFEDRIHDISEHVHATHDREVASVKFEAIVATEVFDELRPLKNNGEPYKRPRDFVSGIISSRNKELAKYITLVPLRECGTDSSLFITEQLKDMSVKMRVTSYEAIQYFIDDKLSDGAKQEFNGLHYEIDGVVVSVFGGDKLSSGFVIENEIAIKILNLVQETRLLDVKYQFGKQGRITPVAVVEPVKFDNVTVTNITLSTPERITSMNLRYGDTVRIMYNIVPYLIDSRHDGQFPVQLPTKCPICGHDLDFSTLKQVRCSNPKCDGLQLGSIVRYCENMKMFGLGKGVITKLFDAGLVKSILDLYRLEERYDELSTLPGFGVQSANNILDSIKEASTDVQLCNWLGALPIRDTSTKTWKEILNYTLTVNKYSSMNEYVMMICKNDCETFISRLYYPPGVGRLKLARIAEGLRQHWDMIQKVIGHIKFSNSDAKTSNKVVTLTGTRDSALTEELTRRGYTVDSFSKKTVALVIPHVGFTSNKVEMAKKNNIPIYTIEEAYQKL